MRIVAQLDDLNTSGELGDSNNLAVGNEIHYNVDHQGDKCVPVKTVTLDDAPHKSTGTLAMDDLNKPILLAGSDGEIHEDDCYSISGSYASDSEVVLYTSSNFESNF